MNRKLQNQLKGPSANLHVGVSRRSGETKLLDVSTRKKVVSSQHSPATGKRTNTKIKKTTYGQHMQVTHSVNAKKAGKVAVGGAAAGLAAYGGYKAVKAYRNHKQGTRTSNPTPIKTHGRVRRKG